MSAVHPLADDWDDVCERVGERWQALAGKRLLITGGTGFVGTWLLETLAWANRRRGLDLRAVVLSRDAAAFRARAPHLADDPLFEWLAGDVRSFAFPAGRVWGVVHAAFDSSAPAPTPRETIATIVDGTRRVLDCAAAAGAERLLFVSSGAVYGPQPPNLERVPETFCGAPSIASPAGRSAYGEAKRLAELLTLAAGDETGLAVAIARCFAFVGPHQPLDRHYAVANFLGDLLAGRAPVVRGDGTPWRSYLYAADLAEWLWTIFLAAPPATIVNVGSEEGLPIGELARRVAALGEPPLSATIIGVPDPRRPAERYVPDCRRAAELFGLGVAVPLDTALRKTLAWHRRGVGS